jgi:membrane fusion protein (multidrug efflux system)
MRFCCCLLLLLCSCSSEKKPPPLPPVDVTEFTVAPKTIPVIFDYIGFAESSHPVEIRARVEGFLDRIAYQEGQLVHENDLMFQLDPRQFLAKVEEAKGEVARQQALAENAQLTVNRLKPLYEQKAASKKDLDNATAQLLSTQAALLSAKAELVSNEINLGYTTIRSPINGYADKSKLREGALINPGANSLLTTVSVLDPIWVYFTVSDNDILRYTQQHVEDTIILPKEDAYEVEALMSDGSAFPYKGKVDYASPTYDQGTGTILARAVFPNPKADLRPGQFVRIKVYGAERPNAIYVPQRAIMQKKNGMFVYLIDKEGKAASQDVSGGSWYGDYQIITNGLKTGDKVIVDGINKVRPGVPVHVIGTWTSPKTSSTDS